MRWCCPSPVRYYYPLRISRLIADVRSCFADVCFPSHRVNPRRAALDRPVRSPPRSAADSAMPEPVVRYGFSPAHPHLYEL